MRRLLVRAAGAGVAGAAAASAAAAAHARTEAPPPIRAGGRAADGSAPAGPSSSPPAPAVELLVHNISHSDLILQLRLDDKQYKARPMFNQFMPVALSILGHMDDMAAIGAESGLIECVSKYQVKYPIGLDLEAGPTQGAKIVADAAAGGGQEAKDIAIPWERFHLKGFRRHDGAYPELPQTADPLVVGAIMPHIAVVIPEWLRVLKRKALHEPPGQPPPRKVLVLVSGAGQPRDSKTNPTHNSTEGTAQIMKRFVQQAYPDIEVVTIASKGSVFRYDDNVNFVKEKVLPVVEAERTRAVELHGDTWKRNLNVTLTLADGAPARISALNASLRAYAPSYLHVWKLKTYWDEGTISEQVGRTAHSARASRQRLVVVSHARSVCPRRRTWTSTRSPSWRCARPCTAHS